MSTYEVISSQATTRQRAKIGRLAFSNDIREIVKPRVVDETHAEADHRVDPPVTPEVSLFELSKGTAIGEIG